MCKRATFRFVNLDAQWASSLKQCNPRKPKKWGYKAFAMCGTDGMLYNYFVYCHKIELVPNRPDLSASGNSVLALAEIVPDNRHHKNYFENWFTGLGLLKELFSRGILSQGTFRSNRIKAKLTSDKDLKKKRTGFVL